MPRRSPRAPAAATVPEPPPEPAAAPAGRDLALLVLLVAAFCFPYLFLGRSMLPLELVPVFQPWARHSRELWDHVPPVWNPLLDSIQQYYPRRVYMGEALRGGWLPLWIPHVYGGSPFLATQQGAVFYPPAWLLTLFAPERQFGYSAFFHLSLAAVGGYLVLLELGLRRAAAMAGAVAFTFNGFIVIWLAYPNVTQWTLCWLPLALYLWERGRRLDDLRWSAACGAVLALNLLGGHAQTSAYFFLTWGAWSVFRVLTAERPRENLLRWVLLPAALGIALSLAHLLPTLDYVPRTDRGERVPWPSVVRAAMPPTELWTFLLPRLFGDSTFAFGQQFWLPQMGHDYQAYIERSFYPGVSVLALAAGALAVPRSQHVLRRLAAFSGLLSLLALLWALATPLYWPLWAVLPGFRSFTAVERIVCVAAWPLACLAALGVHSLTDAAAEVRATAFRTVAAAGVVLALLAGLGHYIYGAGVPQELAEFIERSTGVSLSALALRDLAVCLGGLAAVAVIGGLSGKEVLKPGLGGALLVAVVAGDLFAFGFPFNPKSDSSLLHKSTPELQALESRADRMERFLSSGPPGQEEDIRHRMPSNLAATFHLDDISGSDSFQPKRFLQWREALKQSADGKSPWARLGAPDLRSAAVRYYLTDRSDLTDQAGLTRLGEALLYEDPEALPYARLHLNAQPLPTQAELLRVLGLPDRATAIALTVGGDAPVFNGAARVVPFTARRVNGNRVVVEGEAPQAGLLVVSEGWEPGWTARVDGVAARVVPADWLLLGVPVTPGRHRVELVYAPQVFRVGLFVTLSALAALAAMLAGARQRVRAERR